MYSARPIQKSGNYMTLSKAMGMKLKANNGGNTSMTAPGSRYMKEMFDVRGSKKLRR